MNFITQWFLETLKKWNFIVNPLSKTVNNLEDVEKEHQKIDQLRSSLDYDIDGLVLKVNDLNLQKRLEALLIPQDGP